MVWGGGWGGGFPCIWHCGVEIKCVAKVIICLHEGKKLTKTDGWHEYFKDVSILE